MCQQSLLWQYKSFSDMHHCPTLVCFNQPTLLTRVRNVQFGSCKLRVWPTPCYLYGHIHIEARDAATWIESQDGVWINTISATMPSARGFHKMSRHLICTWGTQVSGCATP